MPDDLTALRELERVPLGLPSGLELEWLGVAGYRLSYEGTTVLVDPYVSRVPIRAVLLRRPTLPDAALLDRYVARADAVLIGHTHWDHAVDAPAIARRDGATVYGSDSLARLMALHGLSPGAYKCGDVFGIRIEVAGTSFYHQGSADLRDDERFEPVDVFLAGVTGRQVTPYYWRRILPRLDPRVVVPTHYDNFFAPLDRPLTLVRRVDLSGLPEEIAAVSGATTLAAVPRDPGRPRATPGSRR